MTARRFSVLIGADEVVGVLHAEPGARRPCVVACHGMGASKDSEKYLLLAREFPAAGLALARLANRGRLRDEFLDLVCLSSPSRRNAVS